MMMVMLHLNLLCFWHIRICWIF